MTSTSETAAAEAPSTAPSAGAQDAANPFKGLAYFEREDATRFGGRGRDVRRISATILKSRTLVLYGRSGLGKTSLVLAGIVPQLEAHRCRPVYVRALLEPLEDLRRALIARLGGDPGEPLRALIDRADDHGPVVIVFDQFEEFFIRFSEHSSAGSGATRGEAQGGMWAGGDREGRRRIRHDFIREIGRLAGDDDLNLRLVFSLREDWVAEMEDFESAVSDIAHTFERLLPLTAFGVRRSIAQLLKSAGVAFDSRLISALVEELAEVDFDPSILQVVCSEVWIRSRRRQGAGAPPRLELDDLRAMGGIRGIFEGYLDQVTREIPESDPRLKLHTRAVLDSLITPQRTKRAARKPFLLERYFRIEPAELDRVLELLCRHRIARLDPRAGESWYELMHERLIETIILWLDRDADFFKFRAARNLVANSCANRGWHQNPGLLLSREQLDGTVGPYKELLRFSGDEQVFLASSAIHGSSRDLDFWARQVGLETAREILARLLDDPDADARRRGVAAAGGIADESGELLGRCLEIALEDDDEEVRRAAGRAFAARAGERHFRRLRRRLAVPKTRERARAILVDCLDAGHEPPRGALSRLELFYARRLVFERRRQACRGAIRARAAHGALGGLLAALAGVALTAPLFLLLVRERFPEQAALQPLSVFLLLREGFPARGALDPRAAWVMYAAAAIPALLLGTLVGWRCSVKAAEAALRTGREGRFFTAIRPWLPRFLLPWTLRPLLYSIALTRSASSDASPGLTKLLSAIVILPPALAIVLAPPVLLGLAFVLVLLLLDAWLGSEVVLQLVLLPIVVLLLSALLALLARPGLWPAVRGWRAWLHAWCWAFAPAALLYLLWPGVFDLGVGVASGDLITMMRGTSGVLPALLGLVSFAAMLALARSSPGGQVHDLPELRLGLTGAAATGERRRRRWRRLSVAGGLALAATAAFKFAYDYGLDSLPFMAHRLTAGETSAPQRLPFANAEDDTSFFAVRTPTAGGHLMDLGWRRGRSPEDRVIALHRRVTRLAARRSSSADGSWRLVISRNGGLPAAGGRILPMIEKAVTDSSSGPRPGVAWATSDRRELVLEPDAWQLATAGLEHDSASRRWTGELRGEAPADGGGRLLYLLAANVVQGGDWCEDTGFWLRIDGGNGQLLPGWCQAQPTVAAFRHLAGVFRVAGEFTLHLEIKGLSPRKTRQIAAAAENKDLSLLLRAGYFAADDDRLPELLRQRRARVASDRYSAVFRRVYQPAAGSSPDELEALNELKSNVLEAAMEIEASERLHRLKADLLAADLSPGERETLEQELRDEERTRADATRLDLRRSGRAADLFERRSSPRLELELERLMAATGYGWRSAAENARKIELQELETALAQLGVELPP